MKLGSALVAAAMAAFRHLRLLLSLVAVIGVAAMATGGVHNAAGSDRTVRSEGTEMFVPNAKIMATLRFSPGHLVVNSGDTITFTHADKTEDPHTLSIVDESDVPTDIDQVFNCGAPGTVCDEVFQLFGATPGCNDDPALCPRIVEGPGTGDGLDGRLDSLLIFPGESIEAEVSAPSGSTLHFICAIHPWMQGTIDVH